MAFQNAYFSKEERYWIGTETELGVHYISFPVSNGIVDYVEYYKVTPDQYDVFLANKESALKFVESCRRHEHDELLIQKPGRNRGTPI
ncbi:hypothetical protein [Mycobacteroides abscessus]|uniref:hypothetical protein n=1 Tax=Mycobacteroides abscessus TaxID=36809 RepID=UPI000C260048|nr:hypothetical protein [Mycobacteroides abscessus]